MPTYDYECDACGHKEEVFQSFSDPLIEKCPKCKKKKFRRLFGAGAAVMFKGTGFYTTDYRSDSYKKAASADSKPSESSSSTSADSSKSSEAKPAAPAPKSDAPASGSSGGSSSGKSKKKD